MKRVGPFVLLAGLAACDSPGPAYLGTQGAEVSARGFTYRVHRRGAWVEVYRIGFALLPRRAEVLAGAAEAIEAATGCPARPGTLTGDAAIQRARLACATGQAPPAPGVAMTPTAWHSGR